MDYSNMSIDDLFAEFIRTLHQVKVGEEFMVRDLFRGFQWNRIPRGNRTKLGGAVFQYAITEGKNVIVPTEKTPQNQQKYKKL